jgi:hypothetical protein
MQSIAIYKQLEKFRINKIHGIHWPTSTCISTWFLSGFHFMTKLPYLSSCTWCLKCCWAEQTTRQTMTSTAHAFVRSDIPHTRSAQNSAIFDPLTNVQNCYINSKNFIFEILDDSSLPGIRLPRPARLVVVRSDIWGKWRHIKSITANATKTSL